MREANYMGVDDDPLVSVKSIAENHVRRLPAHARQSVQLFHRLGDPAPVLGDDGARRAANAFRFASEKTGRANHFFQRRRRCFGVIGGTPVLGEQSRCHRVHALVGALRGQNRGDEKLERIFEIEFAMRGRVNFRERFEQLRDSFPGRHRAASPGLRLFPTIAFARASARCAQANSVAKIARPMGITMKAGPGRTISATPIKRTVPPIIAMMSLRREVTKNFISRYVAALGERVNGFCSRFAMRSVSENRRGPTASPTGRWLQKSYVANAASFCCNCGGACATITANSSS